MSARLQVRGRRAGDRGQCCTPCAARPAARSGRSVLGEQEPNPAGQCPRRPRPRAPSRHRTCQQPLSPHTAPNGPAPPARRPPPTNGKPVARQRAHLNGPIRRPSPSPSLYGDRGMRSLIHPPATCPAHSLREALPTPSVRPRPLSPPRAERGKSAHRRAGRLGGGKVGREEGEGREEPRRRERFQREEGRAAGVENSRQEAACRQCCPPTRPRSAASRLPRIPPGEPASLYGRHPGRAAGRGLGSPPWTLPSQPQHRGGGLSAALDGAVRRLSGTRGAPPLPGGRG